MKILLLTNIFPTAAVRHGGAFIEARVRAMRQLGVIVDPVAVGARPAGMLLEPLEGYRDATVPATRLQRALLRSRGTHPGLITESVNRISEVIAGSDYTGVMAHGMFSLGAGHIALEIGRASAIPFSVHLHGSDVNQVMQRAPRVFAKTLNAATAAVFVSEALHHRARTLGYTGANHVVIPNGVDLRTFSRNLKSSQKDEKPDSPVACFVGNLIPVKGADRLVDIFREMVTVEPKMKFVVVGDGPLRDRLKHRVIDLDVQFLGRVPPSDVARVMASSNVLLLPSRSEGWPCVIHEAYAVGTPVVATQVGGVVEALVDPSHAVSEGSEFARRFAATAIRAIDEADSDQLAAHAQDYGWESVVKRELVELGTGLPNG